MSFGLLLTFWNTSQVGLLTTAGGGGGQGGGWGGGGRRGRKGGRGGMQVRMRGADGNWNLKKTETFALVIINIFARYNLPNLCPCIPIYPATVPPSSSRNGQQASCWWSAMHLWIIVVCTQITWTHYIPSYTHWTSENIHYTLSEAHNTCYWNMYVWMSMYEWYKCFRIEWIAYPTTIIKRNDAIIISWCSEMNR